MDKEEFNQMFPKGVLNKIENPSNQTPQEGDFDLAKERRAHIRHIIYLIIKYIALTIVIAACTHYLIVNWAAIRQDAQMLEDRVRDSHITNSIPKINISIEKRTPTRTSLVEKMAINWQTYSHPELGYKINYAFSQQEPPFDLIRNGQPQVVWFYYSVAPLNEKDPHLKGKIELRKYSVEACAPVLTEVAGKVGTAKITLGSREYTTGTGDVSGFGDSSNQFFYITQVTELQSACIAAVTFAELPAAPTEAETTLNLHRQLVEEMMASFTLI